MRFKVRKRTFWQVRTKKAQINLSIHAAWPSYTVHMKKLCIFGYLNMCPVKILIRLRECAGWSESSRRTCPKVRFPTLLFIPSRSLLAVISSNATVSSATLSVETLGVLQTPMSRFWHSLRSICSYPTLIVDTTFRFGPEILVQRSIWQFYEKLYQNSRKQVLIFHANCLYQRQFAWNVKTCFLKKKKRKHINLSSAELAKRVVKIKKDSCR